MKKRVCVCILGFQTNPSEPQSNLDRGLRFSSFREAGGFTSARKCQIRGKFQLSRLNPGKGQSPCVFA